MFKRTADLPPAGTAINELSSSIDVGAGWLASPEICTAPVSEQIVVEARRTFLAESASLRAIGPNRMAVAAPLQITVLRTTRSRCSELIVKAVSLLPRTSVLSLNTRGCGLVLASERLTLPVILTAVIGDSGRPLTDNEQFCK